MHPAQLGRFRITDKIGEGAMGVVYRAFDPLLERPVAIKTVRLDLSPEEREEFERRFFLEARSAARLNHPAIVTVFDAGKEGDTAYMAMELLEGPDLRHTLAGGRPLEPRRVMDIGVQIAEGLDYAHRCGVVHRDIKPANVVLLDSGAVKIADFGIARPPSGARTVDGRMAGTPKYMAPEQLSGREVDGRADIFALGAVLYELLCGASPFDADNVPAIMYRVLHETPAWAGLPPGWAEVLGRALAKRPEDRYPNAAALAAALRRLAPGVDAAPPGAATGWRSGRRLVAGLAAMALLGAGLGYALVGRRPTATLTFAVAPWGNVLVDGKSVGASPPLRELPLAAGPHQIEIRNGRLPPLRVQVDLRAGETRAIKHRF